MNMSVQVPYPVSIGLVMPKMISTVLNTTRTAAIATQTGCRSGELRGRLGGRTRCAAYRCQLCRAGAAAAVDDAGLRRSAVPARDGRVAAGSREAGRLARRRGDQAPG